MDFDDEQIERYSRHILLPEVGGTGQARLLEAKVLVVGAGGLGSPLLLYLAAAGVGTIGVIDDDIVDLSNLQRQIIHTTDRIGVAKVESAARTATELNPGVKIVPYQARLTAENALDLVADYDLVADGTDNFATRFLVGDACYLAKRPLVSGAIMRFDGQIATYKGFLGEGHPCHRCLFREPPPPGMIPSCSEAGVLGSLPGTVGSLQATEVIKEILGIGDSLSGHMVIYDALGATFRKVRVPKDRECPLCGPAASIADLSAHRIAA